MNKIALELLIVSGALTAAVIVFLPLRRLVKRAGLMGAYLAGVLAAACYLSVLIVEPVRIQDRSDPLTWWLNRAVAGALLFVVVRIIDRVLVIPMFSRGGTIQVPRFIHQLIQIVLSVFVVLMYGQIAFGWPINGFLTGGAVVSIVLGLALQESLGNLFSGLVLQAAPPFVLGDFILVGSLEGKVVDMTWRAVTLHTVDDNYVVIPNGSIAKQEIVNFHAPDSSTARHVKIGLEYDLPPCDASAVLLRAMAETAGVETDPPPMVYLLDFADYSITYDLKFWVKEPARHLIIEQQVRTNAWYRLREKGYNMPSPIRTVEHVNLLGKQRRQSEHDFQARLQTLSNVPLLEPLSVPQHQELARGARSVRLAPGQVLFEQDDPGESLYIVKSGSADIVVKSQAGTSSVVATLGPGNVIGEMSALTGQPRTATVRAAAPLELIEICKHDFKRITDADPSILEKFSELISARNAHRDAHLQQVRTQEENAASVRPPEPSLLSKMVAFLAK